MSSASLGHTLGLGFLGGVGAGIFFLLFNLIMSSILGLGFLGPLRQIAAIAMGAGVLPATSSLVGPVIVGLLVHVSLSGLYGATFAVAARYIAILRRDMMVATTVFGLGIWVVNYYVFTPWLFPWFDDSPDIVQFIAHTVFYGVPLGIILLEFTPSGGILANNWARTPMATRDSDATPEAADR
jgi:hypothetical protein